MSPSVSLENKANLLAPVCVYWGNQFPKTIKNSSRLSTDWVGLRYTKKPKEWGRLVLNVNRNYQRNCIPIWSHRPPTHVCPQTNRA